MPGSNAGENPAANRNDEVNESLSRWLMFGFFSIPLVLLTYFYLLLHLGFGLPVKDLVYPALIFCAFVPFFSVLTCWGYRARVRGKNGVLMFIAFGAFALLCGFEFRYFEMKMGFSSTSPGFVIVWASVITVGGYYMEKWVRNARVRNRQG